MTDAPLSRRALLAGAAGALSAQALRRSGLAQTPEHSAALAPPPDSTKGPGSPASALGQRSAFERPRRIGTGSISLTPPQDPCGIGTPADRPFGRHPPCAPRIGPPR